MCLEKRKIQNNNKKEQNRLSNLNSKHNLLHKMPKSKTDFNVMYFNPLCLDVHIRKIKIIDLKAGLLINTFNYLLVTHLIISVIYALFFC